MVGEAEVIGDELGETDGEGKSLPWALAYALATSWTALRATFTFS